MASHAWRLLDDESVVGVNEGRITFESTTMDPSHYFLRDPDYPDRFRWTRSAWEELGPRFARQGIRLDALRTIAAVEAAAHQVREAEYDALTPAQLADPATVDRLYDLLFLTDPLRGVPPLPPESLEAKKLTVREILRRLGADDPPPAASGLLLARAADRLAWVFLALALALLAALV